MKLLVVILRGANTGLLPAYGNFWVHLPNLSVLSARGLILDHYYATSWNEDAIRSVWLSGRFPNGAPSGGSWLEELKKAGWQTSFLSDLDDPCSRKFAGNFAQSKFLPEAGPDPLLLHEALLADPVFQSPGDGVAWVETGFLQPPWRVREDFLEPAREELHDYLSSREEIDEGIELPDPVLNPGELKVLDDSSFMALQSGLASAWAQVDDFLGAIAASLQESFPKNDYALVITSDRGLGAGEHGGYASKPPLLYREWVHLPFLLYAPFLNIAGRRMLGFWQDVDLAPTLLDLARLPVLNCEGSSILKGENIFSGSRNYAVSEFHDANGAFQCALRTGRQTFLESSDSTGLVARKFFVLPEDRLELNDASKANSGHVEDCEKVMAAWSRGEKDLAGQLLKAMEGGH